ncbi:MAG: hypothetical protein IID32_05420, partial [Planctomycetes bacterium]|nr:hypothetical protein [Planctomycetota bacterium]
SDETYTPSTKAKFYHPKRMLSADVTQSPKFDDTEDKDITLAQTPAALVDKWIHDKSIQGKVTVLLMTIIAGVIFWQDNGADKLNSFSEIRYSIFKTIIIIGVCGLPMIIYNIFIKIISFFK